MLFIGRLCVIFVAVSLFFTLLYKFINPPLTPLMAKRFFEQAFDEKRTIRFERDYVSLEDIFITLTEKAKEEASDENEQ